MSRHEISEQQPLPMEGVVNFDAIAKAAARSKLALIIAAVIIVGGGIAAIVLR